MRVLCFHGLWLQVGYEGGGGSVNVQGEEQKKLDVVTNDVLKRALKFTGKVIKNFVLVAVVCIRGDGDTRAELNAR